MSQTIRQMDQVTQQNAAMVEEATAATRALTQECDGLVELMGQFHLSVEFAPQARTRPVERPAERTMGRQTPTVRPRPASAAPPTMAQAPLAKAAGQDWEEF